ncbi:MAG: hypothetical protein DI582_05930 [Azospirillum brasilense]|nr:MAG: hypothetical protein DI582_05930 [Azospirillum brasilense]
MKPVQLFAVRPEPGHAPGQYHYISELLAPPAIAPDMWAHMALLGQYACAAGYLVLLEDPDSFEKGPFWLLFSADLTLLDEGARAVMYDGDETTNLAVDGNDAVRFDWFGRRWRLQVLPKPRWYFFDMGTLFLPVWRKRWFVLKRLQRVP